MLILHHLNDSRSQRVIWLLEVLGVDYEIKRYQRDQTTFLAPASAEAIHPLGKFPMLSDGDHVVAESAVIIEYLLETHGGAHQLVPSGSSPTYWQYRYWMHYAESSLMPLLLMKLMFGKMREAKMPFFIKPIARLIADKAEGAYAGPNAEKHLNYVEQHLSKNKWFAGEQMTGADFMMIFPLEASMSRETAEERYPNIRRYVAQVHALPEYQTALRKGGDYSYARTA